MRIAKTVSVLLGILFIVALAGAAAWFLYLRSQTQPAVQNTGTLEQGSEQNTTSVSSNSGNTSTNQPSTVTQPGAAPRIAELSTGPVASATVFLIGTPTTTMARFVMADNGHVFDIPVASPGAVSHAVSNTTIPGITSAQWEKSNAAALFQYLDAGVVKTLYVGFPPTSATSTDATVPTHIQFLPDDIVSYAIAPDSSAVAYLLGTASGVDGYVANAAGIGGKKLFSLPLSQVLLSWPSQGSLMVQTRAAAGVPGIAFSVNVKTGATAQLVYAPGLSAIASPGFDRIVYETTPPGASNRATYARDDVSGNNIPLSFQPLPEKCVWSPVSSIVLYCAVPLSYTPANYLDLWHAGSASAVDSIVSFNVATGQSQILATPGQDGGSAVDIASLAISPDGQYVIYVAKGDRSLWSLRLAQ